MRPARTQLLAQMPGGGGEPQAGHPPSSILVPESGGRRRGAHAGVGLNRDP